MYLKFPLIFPLTNYFIVHNIYTLPFKPLVWLSCLISVLLSTILLHLTSQSAKEKSSNTSHHKRITDSALSSVAVVCQMDASFRSTVTSSRIIMVSIILIVNFQCVMSVFALCLLYLISFSFHHIYIHKIER